MKKSPKMKLLKETLSKLDVARGGEEDPIDNRPSTSYYCTQWSPCGGGGGGSSQPVGSGVVCGTGYSCYLH